MTSLNPITFSVILESLLSANDLTDEQVNSLLVVVDQSDNLMHQLVIYLLFFTGIRKNELINLKYKDFHQKGDLYLVDVIAKGKKQITNVIGLEVKENIDSYKKYLM